MRNWLIIAFGFFVGLNEVNAQFLRTIKKFPDTGQTGSFTATFGEDHDYVIFSPLFSVWNSAVVVDSITGLMWQRGDGGEMTIENARIYADTFTLMGFSDWRLPNILESYTILNHQQVNPSLDVSVFNNTGAEYWWTVDRQFNDSTKIWCTNAGGGAGNHRKTETISAGGTKRFHPRLVRDVALPSVLPQRFQALGNGLISDAWSGFVWQSQYTSDSLSWENALTYADTCSMGGFTDWRLPNIKEMQSLVDVSRNNPAMAVGFFTNQGAQKYWTSTSLPNAPLKAWIFDSQWGITTYDWKTLKHRVLLVRGLGNSPNSIGDHTNKFIRVYPNPMLSGSFTIEGISENDAWQMVDVQGEIVAQGVGNQGVISNQIPKGTYGIMVKNSFLKVVVYGQ